MEELNGYQLSRDFFDWSFENPEKITPTHVAMYFFIIEHCNRLGWKEKFGLPTSMVKDAIGIRNFRTYINTLNDLCDWGFLVMIEKSKNQYSSNIIAIVKNAKARAKALDKALQKHRQKHSKSIDSINKQETIEQSTIKQEEIGTNKKFVPPTLQEIEFFISENKLSFVDPEAFFNHYTSNGWNVGKNKMKNWESAVKMWNARNKNEKPNYKHPANDVLGDELISDQLSKF